MRTFVAIEMPASVRQVVADVQQRLAHSLAAASMPNLVRWTAPQHLHLTLRFLGETSDAQRLLVERELASRLPVQPACALALHQLGVFPNWRRPNIIWVDFAGATTQLLRVQSAVERAVQAVGFAAEERPFTPHLTIGRVARDAGPPARQQLGERVQREQAHCAAQLAAAAAHFTAEAVAFVQSDLRPSGPIYTTLASYSLKG
jgi:2'-5' RNA ligase